MHKFKPLAATAFKSWTQEQCEWIAKHSKVDDIARKVALYILKKKFQHTTKQHELFV